MEQTSLRDFQDFVLENGSIITDLKVTNTKVCDFNNMEGWQYYFNVKIVTNEKYKNKLIVVHTNSSWLEDDQLKPLEYFNDIIIDGLLASIALENGGN